MSNKKTATPNEVPSLSSSHKSYLIDEIMAAGGATAFANKLGKGPKAIAESFKKLPTDAFLTEEEASAALKTLEEHR